MLGHSPRAMLTGHRCVPAALRPGTERCGNPSPWGGEPAGIEAEGGHAECMKAVKAGTERAVPQSQGHR